MRASKIIAGNLASDQPSAYQPYNTKHLRNTSPYDVTHQVPCTPSLLRSPALAMDHPNLAPFLLLPFKPGSSPLDAILKTRSPVPCKTTQYLGRTRHVVVDQQLINFVPNQILGIRSHTYTLVNLRRMANWELKSRTSCVRLLNSVFAHALTNYQTQYISRVRIQSALVQICIGFLMPRAKHSPFMYPYRSAASILSIILPLMILSPNTDYVYENTQFLSVRVMNTWKYIKIQYVFFILLERSFL